MDRGRGPRGPRFVVAMAVIAAITAACGSDVAPTPAPADSAPIAAAATTPTPTRPPTPTPSPSATVRPTPTPTPTPSPTPAASPDVADAAPACAGRGTTAEGGVLRAQSLNWGGYIARQSGARVVCVQARWTQPTFKCPSKGERSVAIWVGFDGDRTATKSQPLIQTGTAVDCVNGVQRSYAWHELYPTQLGSQPYLTVSIKPGDRIAASVEYRKSTFVLTVVNLTTGGRGVIIERAPKALRQSAEWIVEAPTGGCPKACHILPLAPFPPIRFTDARATIGSRVDGVVGPWNRERTTMVTRGGTALVRISGVTSSGDGFTVTRS